MGGLIDPLMLVAGIGMYTNRVMHLERRKEVTDAVNAAERLTQRPQPTANGAVHSAQAPVTMGDILSSSDPIPETSIPPAVPSVDNSIAGWFQN
jgi:hypothetical protein